MRKRSIRNVVVSGGAYYVSMWVAPLVVMAFAPLTNRLTFLDGIETAAIMPLVIGFPLAVVAIGTGALTAWLVESTHAWRWAIIPTVLYAVFNFFGHHWMKPPELQDRIAQSIQSLLPAVACVVGAWVLDRRQFAPRLKNT